MTTIPARTGLFQTATLKKSMRRGGAIHVSSPRRSTLVAIAIATLGCGGKRLTPAQDAGPVHEATPTVDASTSALCAVAAPTTAPPYAVQFQLHDDGAASAFLLNSCGLSFGVSSCERRISGITSNDFVFCACSCAHPQMRNRVRRLRFDQATEIAAGALDGAAVERHLDDRRAALDRRRGAPQGGDLPTRAATASRSPSDASAAGALARSGPRVVSRDFELRPRPNGRRRRAARGGVGRRRLATRRRGRRRRGGVHRRAKRT